MANTQPYSRLAQSRKAADMAAGLSFPSSLVAASFDSTHFSAENAGGDNYLRLCAAGAKAILVYLHTFSGNYQQLQGAGNPYPNITWNAFLGAFPYALMCPDFGGACGSNVNAFGPVAAAQLKTDIDEMKYKTGLSRVRLIGASGGATMGLNFMSFYPGYVDKASLWFPTYNFAQQYLDLVASDPGDTTGLRAAMVAIFGHAPVNNCDADYLARSPQNLLPSISGPTEIFINTGTSDTTAPAAYGNACAAAITAAATGSSDPDNNAIVHTVSWSCGHVFGVTPAATGTGNDYNAMKQLLLG